MHRGIYTYTYVYMYNLNILFYFIIIISIYLFIYLEWPFYDTTTVLLTTTTCLNSIAFPFYIINARLSKALKYISLHFSKSAICLLINV